MARQPKKEPLPAKREPNGNASARRYATKALAEDLVEDIEGSGHNSKYGSAQVWLQDAYLAGWRARGRRK